MLFSLLLAAAAVQAPITQVTVFSDRARVTREATVIVGESSAVEFPLLPDGVDTDSVRLEAQGAQVRQVTVAPGETEGAFDAGEAQQLLEKLEKLDDKLAALDFELRARGQELRVLRNLNPQLPPSEPLKPPQKLAPQQWTSALSFVDQNLERVQARIRELREKGIDLQDERRQLSERAQQVGGARREHGIKVSAVLSGKGAAKLSLVYALRGASWSPGYELQYRPGEEKVDVQFGGSVSQATGEDWTNAQLVLSTAVPGQYTRLPKLLTWKIGNKERFEPVSHATRQPPRPMPAPNAPAEPRDEAAQKREELRSRLLSLAGSPESIDFEEEDEAGRGGAVSLGATGKVAYGAGASGMAMRKPAPPPPPASAPMPVAPAPMKMEARARNYAAAAPAVQAEARNEGAPEQSYIIDAVTEASPQLAGELDLAAPMEVAVTSKNASSRSGAARGPRLAMGLSPPPAYVPPTFPPNSPASLAGGYDLSFPAVHRASVTSGGPQRRVGLFSETWPVKTERVVWPGLGKEALLIARLKNPSQHVLPGGSAELFVGEDPSGTARISLTAPGQEISLPLGIDRAVKAERNVAQVQTETGLISKDEVTEYTVTIEVANPYTHPLALRVVDQVPLAGDKNTTITLKSTSPQTAERKDDTGELTWRMEVPASSKQVVTFSYELKRPKGYRVHQ
ncbi:MAG: DUF4139 domain-containing protein [Deltaproteobacteria bacterium]|nr:DUF4139 domain-containing protein [Deltaproteobacteria bacterium]